MEQLQEEADTYVKDEEIQDTCQEGFKNFLYHQPHSYITLLDGASVALYACFFVDLCYAWQTFKTSFLNWMPSSKIQEMCYHMLGLIYLKDMPSLNLILGSSFSLYFLCC